MARLTDTMVIKIDEFFTRTRIVKCGLKLCVYNENEECALKEVHIKDHGLCDSREEVDSETK